MRLKQLYKSTFEIVAVMDDDDCEAYEFIVAVSGLKYMLSNVAEKGLAGVPSAWHHAANPKKTVFAFRKGDFRLFFFKGEGAHIAVCTAGGRKQGQAADKAMAAKAEALRQLYFAAVAAKTIEVIEE